MSITFSLNNMKDLEDILDENDITLFKSYVDESIYKDIIEHGFYILNKQYGLTTKGYHIICDLIHKYMYLKKLITDDDFDMFEYLDDNLPDGKWYTKKPFLFMSTDATWYAMYFFFDKIISNQLPTILDGYDIYNIYTNNKLKQLTEDEQEYIHKELIPIKNLQEMSNYLEKYIDNSIDTFGMFGCWNEEGGDDEFITNFVKSLIKEIDYKYIAKHFMNIIKKIKYYA